MIRSHERLKIVVVDIDREEHRKKTIKIDKLIGADAKNFLQNTTFNKRSNQQWSDTCLRWKESWRICNPGLETRITKE